MNALANGFTQTSATAHRRVDCYTEVQPGPFVIKDSGLDANAHIPITHFRAVDQRWAGKTIVALGASITASNPAVGGTAGNVSQGSGYINQALRALQCIGINNGIGSSYITFTGSNTLALSATTAELNALSAGAGVSGYQNKMIGLNADLVIFDHGYNDRHMTIGTLFSTGTTLNMDRSTFYGAFNYLITQLRIDRPTCRIAMLTPISIFTPVTGDGTPDPVTGFSGTAAIRTAVLALGAHYQVPVLDWTQSFGLNLEEAQPNQVGGTGGNPQNYRGAYNAGIIYAKDDSVVWTDGITYISRAAANTGNTPSFLPGADTWWRVAGHTLDGVHTDQSRHDMAARMLYKFLLTV